MSTSSYVPNGSSELGKALSEARARTLELVADLSNEQMLGPKLDIVNPPLWEIGHVAWFQERWSLRHLRQRQPIRQDGDALYDSAAVHHDTRWGLALPAREDTVQYMDSILEAVMAGLASTPVSPHEVYFHLLPLYHEYMHSEALTYTRQTLGYRPPVLGINGKQNETEWRGPEPRETHGTKARRNAIARPAAGALTGDAEIGGGVHYLGAFQSERFVFDNEKWAHPVRVAPFKIARAAVTNAEFAEFVDAGGYRRSDLWGPEGRVWLTQSGALHPVYWRRREGGDWELRHFDRWEPLPEDLPIIHVNWYEAEAFCQWAHRRLPTEAEWELAASGPNRSSGGVEPGEKRRFPWGDAEPTPETANLDWKAGGCIPVGALPASDSPYGCRQMIGNVWEWTADDFRPFPGFVRDPYKEYSEPWFGDHKVLRGGCWTTRSGLIRNSWRNFYKPHRSDVLAGFRTCSLA